MVTHSEIVTDILARKIFFPRYTFSNVKYNVDKNENELCDCILEFNDYYIFIQVKEKNDLSNLDDYSWFKNKVLKNAVSQTKKSIKIIKSNDFSFFTKQDGNKKDIHLKSDKRIIPLIVFFGAKPHFYDKVYHSNSLNLDINIFSYEDFKVMLETLILPCDIVLYLLGRNIYTATNPYGNRFLFEDVSTDVTIISRPESEKDYADYHIVKYYYNNNVDVEAISFYNRILADLYSKSIDTFPEAFDMLINADIAIADRIVKKIAHFTENIKSESLEFPMFLGDQEMCIGFLRRPYKMDDYTFNCVMSNLGLYYAYKHSVKRICFFVFSSMHSGLISMDVLASSPYSFDNKDADLDNLVIDIEKSFSF